MCDGKTLGDWFGGTVDGDRVVAKSEKGTTLEATGNDGELRGNVILAGGANHNFALRRAGGGDAGLYCINSPSGGKLGTIVLPDGSTRGVSEAGGKTAGTASSGSGEETVGAGGSSSGGATTTTTTSGSSGAQALKKGGVYSPIFRITYRTCEQLNEEIKTVAILYALPTLDACTRDERKDRNGNDVGCSQFVPEFQRIANALACPLNPYANLY